MTEGTTKVTKRDVSNLGANCPILGEEYGVVEFYVVEPTILTVLHAIEAIIDKHKDSADYDEIIWTSRGNPAKMAKRRGKPDSYCGIYSVTGTNIASGKKVYTDLSPQYKQKTSEKQLALEKELEDHHSTMIKILKDREFLLRYLKTENGTRLSEAGQAFVQEALNNKEKPSEIARRLGVTPAAINRYIIQ